LPAPREREPLARVLDPRGGEVAVARRLEEHLVASAAEVAVGAGERAPGERQVRRLPGALLEQRGRSLLHPAVRELAGDLGGARRGRRPGVRERGRQVEPQREPLADRLPEIRDHLGDGAAVQQRERLRVEPPADARREPEGALRGRREPAQPGLRERRRVLGEHRLLHALEVPGEAARARVMGDLPALVQRLQELAQG
jgi:hypothetical protein